MNDIKLVEYILGNISPENDKELKILLEKEDIDQKIADISENIELFATSIKPVKADKQLKERIFSHVDIGDKINIDGFARRVSSFFQITQEKTKQILDSINDLNLPQWQKTFIDGAYIQHFSGGGELAKAHCGLIYLKAGTKVQQHKHIEQEWMLILSGQIHTNDGKTFGAGELILSQSESSHSLVVDDEMDSIFAVITFGDIKFT